MKRILFIVLAIVIAVSCFAVPALADDTVVDGPVVYAPVGPAYIDRFTIFDSSVKADFDGEYVNYYFSMPNFNSMTKLYLNTYSNLIATLYGSRFDYLNQTDVFEGDQILIDFVPFGLAPEEYDNSYKFLELSGITNGSNCRVNFNFSFAGYGFGSATGRIIIRYYDIYNNLVHSQTSATQTITVTDSPNYEDNEISLELDYPSDAVFCYILWNGTFTFGNGRTNIDYTQFTPVVSVGIPEEEFTGNILNHINAGVADTVAGIDRVLYQLGLLDNIDTGIDNILDALGDKLNPIKPGGAGDLGTDTDAIIDNSQGGLDYAGGLLDSIGGSLAQAATGFAALTAVFNLFSIMPFFSLLLQLSVTIGLFGLMTGLIGSIVSKFSVRGKGD